MDMNHSFAFWGFAVMRFRNFIKTRHLFALSQAISRLCDDKYKDLRKAAKKRSVSADNLAVVRWSPAIIS